MHKDQHSIKLSYFHIPFSCQIDVKEEKKQETHPQWEGVTDDEEEDKDLDDVDDSEYDSDEESDD